MSSDLQQHQDQHKHHQESVVCQPGQGEAFSIAGAIYYIKASGAQTNGLYGSMEILVSPGCTSLRHRHDAAESFYVIAGEFAFEIEGQHFGAPTGSFVHIPPKAWHSYHNETQEPARLLCINMPSGIEDFVREVAHVVIHRDAPPVAFDAEDFKRMRAMAPQYQIEPEGE